MKTDHKLFAIFGNPVSHSISPLMHNLALKGLDIDGCYTRYKLEDGLLLKEKFLQLGLSGINVTVPYKETAYKACDEIKGIAKEIGAVNTIINHNGKLIGYNTDAPGFLKSASTFGEINSVLIIGAGGTAKALAAIFKDKGAEVSLLNRSIARLAFFKKRGFYCMDWKRFEKQNYDLVVNTTSAGLEDDSLPCPKEMLEEIFPRTKYAIDVIYNKNTPFLQMAKSYKLPSKDGANMLLYQGVYAFDLFFDHKYQEKDIESFMKQAFA